MAGKREIWDQLDSEPDANYARFLAYRNLGPARSVPKAAAFFDDTSEKAPKGTAGGIWKRDSAEYNWVRRAELWDIAQLERYGRIATLEFVRLIRHVTRRALVNGSKLKGPETWKELLETLHAIGHFITPESVYAVRDNSGDDALAQPNAAGTQPGSVPE